MTFITVTNLTLSLPPLPPSLNTLLILLPHLSPVFLLSLRLFLFRLLLFTLIFVLFLLFLYLIFLFILFLFFLLFLFFSSSSSS